VCVLLAAALRLVWIEDMEYKGDEKLLFELSQTVGRTTAWPMTGTLSGVGVVNPGLSVWNFVILARISRAANPLELTRAVQIVNVLSVLALFGFVLRWLTREDREPWLWAAAMVSVNPFSILFSRKIWEPDLVLPFCLLAILGFLNRASFLGAVSYGFFGALVGQVHMSGFFFSLGLVIWLAVFDRKNVNWLGWFAGSVLGAIPLLPWVVIVLNQPSGVQGWAWRNVFKFEFYRHWVEDTFGLGLDYSLGPHFSAFLKFPIIGASPTYGVLLLHVGLWAAMIWFLVRWAWGFWRNKTSAPDSASTAHLRDGTFWTMGALLTLSGFIIYRHYLNVIRPIEFLWLACVALHYVPRPRVFLLTVWVLQLLLSISFLSYIHQNCGARDGDYGTAYRCQAGSGLSNLNDRSRTNLGAGTRCGVGSLACKPAD